MKRNIVNLSAVLLLFALALCSCGSGETFRYASGTTWGTVYHIKYLSDADLSDSIVGVMNAVDMSLSPFRRGSVVSRVNSGEDVRADEMFTDVMGLSQHVCSVSRGMFDPTVAPLVNLWGFGYKEGVSDCPSKEQIDSALLSVGILQCSVTDDMHIVSKSANTEYNFSAIAKGYGVDKIAEMLRRNGCVDYMVEVGGEISLGGNGPSGDGWVIQVDAPVADSDDGNVHHEALTALRLTDVCVATSGNYRNYRSTSKGNVGHTISPVTGMPVKSDVLSVTVLAPTTALADALATAAMAMPVSEAESMLAAEPDVEALIVVAEADGFRLLEVPGSWSLPLLVR